MKEKYLFFYLKTGGGHISTAKALERYFGKNYAESAEIVLVDGFEETNSLVQTLIIGGYANAQFHAKRAYEFLYLLNKSYIVAKTNQFLLSYFTKSYVKKVILKEKPNKIVIFHFFLIKPIIQTLKELNLDIPVVTVVTDPFTATRTRFLEKAMQYIVSSERMKTYAMSLGIPEKNIKVYPPIIHEKFALPIASNHEEQRLKKTILLLGGGDGLPKGKKILKELSKNRIDAEIIIVCGKNKKLLIQAQKIKKKHPHLQLQIHGFVDTYTLIAASDLVITKGGPASIIEVLLCGKIPLIHTYMRGQEKGNIEFVVENKLGIYETNIRRLTEKAQEMLNADLSVYHKNREKLQLSIGTKQIANYLSSIS